MLQVTPIGKVARTFLWLLCLGSVTATGAERSRLGKHIDAFSLRDFYGKEHSLATCDADLVVVVFLGTECPLAKLYGPRIEALKQKFADRGVAFLGIK